jgi:hypothetical protein
MVVKTHGLLGEPVASQMVIFWSACAATGIVVASTQMAAASRGVATTATFLLFM